jgi:hypothetical protein
MKLKEVNAYAMAASTCPPSVRAARYAKWRSDKLMPEEMIAAIEKQFPPREPSLPSVPQLAMNSAQAFVRNVIHAVSEMRIKPSDEEIDGRRAICKSCPSKLYRASDNRCAHPSCGCYLKAKTWLEAEECPDGHW